MQDESELPYHLREHSDAWAQCSQCGRKSWDKASVGRLCGMPQPSGRECEGVMRVAASATGEP